MARLICGSSSTTRIRPSLILAIPCAGGCFGRPSWGLTPVLNVDNVFTQPGENVLVVSVTEFPFDLGQREMDDVVMMNFHSWQPFAQLEPYLVQQVNLLGRHARCVRPEIENLLLSRRGKQFQRYARPGFGHSLPGKSNFMRWVCERGFRGASGDYGAVPQIFRGPQNAFPQIVCRCDRKSHGLAFLFRNG